MEKNKDKDLSNISNYVNKRQINSIFILIVIIIIVSVSVYIYKKSAPPQPHVFTGSELIEQTAGVKTLGYIYDQNGNLISGVNGYGTKVSYTANAGHGISSLDNRLVLKIGTSHIETAGNLVITQPINISRIENIHDLSKQIQNIHGISSQKILLLETSSGKPIYAYHGYNVKLELSNIPDSTIFRVDGNYLFMANGSYAIIDATLIGK